MGMSGDRVRYVVAMTRKSAIWTLIVVLAATTIPAAIILAGEQVPNEFGGPDWSHLSPRPSP